MANGWVIAVPAWGERCRRMFLGPGLASIKAALDRLRDDYRGSVAARFVVQTDDPVAVAGALRDFETTLVPPPPPGAPYVAFAASHRHAIESALKNERVALLCADMLVSIEAFSASEARLRAGKRAIVAASSRTLMPRLIDRPGPMVARDLLAWTMRHPHPITLQCFHGTGRCHLPWGVYFQDGPNVVLRGFHLHPFAVVKDRDLPFENTVDLGLIDRYAYDEVHLVTDADEMAFAEVSPPDKSFADNPWPIDAGAVVAWALRAAGPMHWWNFRHRIAVAGDPDLVTSDLALADEVLRLCPYAEAIGAAA